MSQINLKLATELLFEKAKEEGLSRQMVRGYRGAGNVALSSEEASEIFAVLEKRIELATERAGVNVKDPVTIFDPEKHVDWYSEWLKGGSRTHWNRHREFLETLHQKEHGSKTAAEIIERLDKESDAVLDRLENPSRSAFQTKGLVLGYVQSGKTANFTAVIAKAADAGYRLIIVLTGIHENLRWQTQQRIDCQLTGEPDNADPVHVEPPELEQHRWLRLTGDENDFDKQVKSKLAISVGRYRAPVLAVMKKNCHVMRKFIAWINAAPKDIRENIPVLLIDDEADQASIDTKYAARVREGKDIDPTATNRCIRTILRAFPRNAYVGYTATPFANFLICAGTKSKEWGADLYPKNFIVSMNKPAGYHGTDEIFQGENKKRFFKEVPESERKLIVSSRRNEASVYPKRITGSLQDAVYSFLLAGAARIARGDANKPATMLIHTSSLTESQGLMTLKMDRLISGIRTGLSDAHESREILKRLETLWVKDFQPASKKFKAHAIPFKDLKKPLRQFLENLQIYELNYGSDDKLDYIRKPDLKVLAVGGNKLSRGLTLGGLVTSFYLRESSQYDTLLQMGRWFGYRNGYEDLTRIYTTASLAKKFEDLALVEREVRDQIKTYEDEKLTPMEMAVRIRVLASMKVTAPNKMGAGRPVQSSWAGSWTQTIWFPLKSPGILKDNLNAGAALLNKNPGFKMDDGNRGWLKRGIDVKDVRTFLEKYQFAFGIKGQTSGIDKTLLLDYIDRSIKSGKLTKWNVAIASPRGAKESLGGPISYGGLSVHPVNRSRRDRNSLRVGVLSTPDHLYIDHPRGIKAAKNAEQKGFIDWRKDGKAEPLLLLYYISKNSKPEKNKKSGAERKKSPNEDAQPLFAANDKKEDVLGVVLVFPHSKHDEGDFVGQDL